jgi:hypothetical protein
MVRRRVVSGAKPGIARLNIPLPVVSTTFILLENGSVLLLESGDKLKLE